MDEFTTGANAANCAAATETSDICARITRREGTTFGFPETAWILIVVVTLMAVIHLARIFLELHDRRKKPIEKPEVFSDDNPIVRWWAREREER